jgi:DNA-binding transcriptional LysR family regulator
VALGHRVSLVPAMDRGGGRCEFRSFAAPKLSRTLRMNWHKSRYQSLLVKKFIEILRREATLLKKDAGHR